MTTLTRLAAQADAAVRGFFWLPCPLCGEHFGGPEWRDILGHDSSIPSPGAQQDPESLLRGSGICPDCTAKGDGCRAWHAIGVEVHPRLPSPGGRMSMVTDLVFVTRETEWDPDLGVSRCLKFEDMVRRYSYSCEPAQDNGTKHPSTAVYFVGGVNYLSHDLVEEIQAGDWPAGTVLYVHQELTDAPNVTVFGDGDWNSR